MKWESEYIQHFPVLPGTILSGCWTCHPGTSFVFRKSRLLLRSIESIDNLPSGTLNGFIKPGNGISPANLVDFPQEKTSIARRGFPIARFDYVTAWEGSRLGNRVDCRPCMLRLLSPVACEQNLGDAWWHPYWAARPIHGLDMAIRYTRTKMTVYEADDNALWGEMVVSPLNLQRNLNNMCCSQTWHDSPNFGTSRAPSEKWCGVCCFTSWFNYHKPAGLFFYGFSSEI